MNGKKSDRKIIEEIYGILFGNPTHQKGLIAKVDMLEKAVRNNTKISWTILVIIVAAGLGVLFK